MDPKDEKGMVNSVEPDPGAIRSESILFGHIFPKLSRCAFYVYCCLLPSFNFHLLPIAENFTAINFHKILVCFEAGYFANIFALQM